MGRDEREGPGRETERVRRIWEEFAPRYDRQMGFWERILFAGGRAWACSQARGDVLEIGIGTGRNLPFYPAGVRLVGVDLSPAALEFARRRAHELKGDVDLRVGDVQALDEPDERFDVAVSTLTLCSIPDPPRAVAEVLRVLRPGGRFVLMEHVRSPLLPVRMGQRLLNPLTVRFGADNLTREPLEYLEPAGFVVERAERLKWGIVERIVAVKPGGAG